jgi:NitT/TauT family transport system substrate-binding protein
MKTNCLNILLLLLLTLNLNSCSDSKKSNTLKVGYIPIADCAQLYVAMEKGYFIDENLNIELLNLPGGAKILEALAGNSVDIGYSNVVSLILARDSGLDFVSLTGGPIED